MATLSPVVTGADNMKPDGNILGRSVVVTSYQPAPLPVWQGDRPVTLETIRNPAALIEITELVDRLLDAIDGELTSRSRVVDGLLDLRLAADGLPDVVAQVDDCLATLPGNTTVTNLWWMETLADLRTTASN